MKNLIWVLLVMMCGCMTDASVFGRPKPQVTFSIHDTNTMLLVKSSALSYAGHKSKGKPVTRFWNGSVEENGTVILLEPTASHAYKVILEGTPGTCPELSVEFENGNNPHDTLCLQPPIGANGTVRIDLWFMVHNDMAFIVPDRSSHWLPPPRPENPGVQRVQSGAEKDKFVLLWKQPRVMGVTTSVSFDVRWSTEKITTANWARAERVPNVIGDKCELDVSLLVAAGARSFAIRAVDRGGQGSAISNPALVDSDSDGIPDVLEIELFGDLSKDARQDTDNDQIPDFVEFRIGLDPNNPDSDGDGLPDGFEMGSINGFNPKKPDSDIDSDGDGFSNLEEYKAGTDIWDSHSHPAAKAQEETIE